MSRAAPHDPVRSADPARVGGGAGIPPLDQAGFTLLEVLVALVVLSVAMVAALQLFGGGLRLARTSGDHVTATLLATARLSELGPPPMDEGTTEGREGEYRWMRRVALEPALLPTRPGDPRPAAVRLARVSVEVRWGTGRRVELVTLRAWRTAP